MADTEKAQQLLDDYEDPVLSQDPILLEQVHSELKSSNDELKINLDYTYSTEDIGQLKIRVDWIWSKNRNTDCNLVNGSIMLVLRSGD